MTNFKLLIPKNRSSKVGISSTSKTSSSDNSSGKNIETSKERDKHIEVQQNETKLEHNDVGEGESKDVLEKPEEDKKKKQYHDWYWDKGGQQYLSKNRKTQRQTQKKINEHVLENLDKYKNKSKIRKDKIKFWKEKKSKWKLRYQQQQDIIRQKKKKQRLIREDKEQREFIEHNYRPKFQTTRNKYF